jgi:hypothetical protein
VTARRPDFGEEIATRDFVHVGPDGVRRPVKLRLGRPYRADTGGWACPAELEGLEPRYVDARGEDALQALCLAITLLRSRLEDRSASGGKLLYADGDVELWPEDIDAMFGRR